VTQSWIGYARDTAVSGGIGAVIAGVGAAVALGLIRRFPRGWWMPGSVLVVAFGVASIYAGPVVLDPLFNTFKPLPPGRARSDVLELARRAHVDVGQVYAVDASRRTTAANAYVTGLGKTKRVVLYDTLLERFDRDEVRLVVAHELAHVHHRDVARGLLYLGLVAPAALPALALSAVGLGMAITTVANQLSRRIEERADAYALELTGAPQPFIGFERRITVQNVAEPEPPGWYQAVFGTHPTTVQRIGAAIAFTEEAGPRADPAGRRTPAGS
jgi:STE24 endopeptidase